MENVEEMGNLEVKGCVSEVMMVAGGGDGDCGGEVGSISNGEGIEASLTD